MNYKIYNIGDIVKVTNSGRTYSSYMSAADTLGADIDPAEYKTYLQGKIVPWLRNKTEHKFSCGDCPITGDLVLVKNIAQIKGDRCETELVLIERLTDKKQFVIGKTGIQFHRHTFLEDDLFEL